MAKPKPTFSVDQLVRSIFGEWADLEGQIRFTSKELMEAIRRLSKGQAPHSRTTISRMIDDWLEDDLVVLTSKRIIQRTGVHTTVPAYAVTPQGIEHWAIDQLQEVLDSTNDSVVE